MEERPTHKAKKECRKDESRDASSFSNSGQPRQSLSLSKMPLSTGRHASPLEGKSFVFCRAAGRRKGEGEGGREAGREGGNGGG